MYLVSQHVVKQYGNFVWIDRADFTDALTLFKEVCQQLVSLGRAALEPDASHLRETMRLGENEALERNRSGRQHCVKKGLANCLQSFAQWH